jgi:hypothetical protein
VSDIINKFLRVEENIGGDIYVIDMEADTDLTDLANTLNTISGKIAFMRKVAARREFAYDEALTDMEAYLAEQDEKVRPIVGKGEEKILKTIQRKKGWIQRAKKINKLKYRMQEAQGHISALIYIARMVELKRNDIRRMPELGEDKGYITKRNFSVRMKKNQRTPVKKEK